VATFRGTEAYLAELTSFAVHQVGDGWEIIAQSDDPYASAYWRVGFVRQYGWCDAGRDRDGQELVLWGVELS
jgi:hypothetical protein